MWYDIKHEGIAEIDKIVGEYNIWELNVIPCAKFKIKIFERSNHTYTGYTNILLADGLGDFCGAIGYGDTEESLEDTISEFFKMAARKEVWEEEDFRYADPYDF